MLLQIFGIRKYSHANIPKMLDHKKQNSNYDFLLATD
jgi:hypothetical protein